MPKGIGKGNNPNSRIGAKNLIPLTEQPLEKQREIRAKGNAARKQKSAAMRAWKDILNEMLTEADIKAMNDAMVSRAKEGNVKAYELIRDTAGFKPGADIDRERLELEKRRIAMEEQKTTTDRSIVVEIRGGADDLAD